MFGYIYKTTDLLNGKIYIGQHHASAFTTKYIGSGKKLRLRIKEIGMKNFKVEMIEACDTQKLLCEREIYWIKYYNSCNDEIGYNIIDSEFEYIKSMKKYYCRGLVTYYNLELHKELRLHKNETPPPGYVKGRLPFTKEHLASLARRGERNGMYGVHRYGKLNPCYGKKWCYNTETLEQRYINKEDPLPEGFVYGYIKGKNRKKSKLTQGEKND